MGHVSEKVRCFCFFFRYQHNHVLMRTDFCCHQTDAFAMGILIIELLISGAIKAGHPEVFPLEARSIVNAEEAEDLSPKVLALAAKGGWDGGSAKKAAKIMMEN